MHVVSLVYLGSKRNLLSRLVMKHLRKSGNNLNSPSCFETRLLPTLTRFFPGRFAFYVAHPFAPFMLS
jgi:hypothetical protein